jgi:protease-4
MIRRIFRFLVRLVVLLVVIVIVAHVVDWWTHRITPGSVIVLTLKGPVIERGGAGFRGLLAAQPQTPLNVVRRVLDEASKDTRIAGLAVKVIDPQMEFAQAQELCSLIHKFKAHHKWTVAYLETAGDFGSGNLPYLVAASTNHVSMMPEGEINLMGVSMRELFARGLLDKIGVRPNFAAIGKYKDAANIFTNKDFTAGQHEEDTALVSDLYGQIVNTVSRERHLEPAQVTALIDQAPLSAKAGLKDHLVDRLEYADQFTDRIKDYQGHHHDLIDYSNYEQVPLIPSVESEQKIAIVYADGAIQRGQGGFDPLLSPNGEAIGSNQMVKALNRARNDSSVRAVVLRINSPGGSVIGSELIRRAAVLLAKQKPLVVSMSGYAASGGYWIATPAAKIYAEPATVTGSIGVLGGKFNIAPMLTSIGVNSGAVSQGANVEMFSSFTDFSPAQQQQFQNRILGDTYHHFVSLVAHSRGMTFAQVNQIAQGRVWSGEQAVKLKLVDGIGGLDTAIAAARKLAKVPASVHLAIMNLPQRPSLLSDLLHGEIGADAAFGTAISPRLRAALWLFDAAIEGHSGSFRAAICPVRPVL